MLGLLFSFQSPLNNPNIIFLLQGELGEEIKTMKKRYKSMMSGEQCGHKDMIQEIEQLKNQIQVKLVNRHHLKTGKMKKSGFRVHPELYMV